jgi:hypothetical protein
MIQPRSLTILIGECRHFEYKEEMEKFGKVVDVGADGNCCPYTSILGLEKIGMIEPGSKTVTEFRRELREFASTNQEQFIKIIFLNAKRRRPSARDSVGKRLSWIRCFFSARECRRTKKDVMDPVGFVASGTSH